MDGKQIFVMEWSGGIGDVFYWMWVGNQYNDLESLKEGEYATVINRCRTPGLEELLSWHPNKDRIELIDLSWHPFEISPEDRKTMGLPVPSGHVPFLKEPVFYPSPEDIKILPGLTASKFIVFALSGSFPEKNVPTLIADKAAEVFLSKGYRIVLVGKTYNRRVLRNSRIEFDSRTEERIKVSDGITDAIDRLTLPGTCELVRASAGVLCCDSSIMHLSLRMKKPTFMVVPDKWFEYWHKVDSASWGKTEPNGGYSRVSDYSDQRLVEWMDRNGLFGEKQ